MARWQERERKAQQRRRRINAGRVEGAFGQLWMDLCYCPQCCEHVFHVELSPYGDDDRNDFVPTCPDCESRLLVVERDRRGFP